MHSLKSAGYNDPRHNRFRYLNKQFGEFTATQRVVLLEAVASGKPADEAIALIEARFTPAPASGHWTSTALQSHTTLWVRFDYRRPLAVLSMNIPKPTKTTIS